MKTRSAIFTALLLTLTTLSFASLAADNSLQHEIATARAHAVMAVNANSIKMTHAHLHHVVNCLAGPRGKAFDASAANPCRGQGNGAINDASQHPEVQRELRAALQRALTASNNGAIKQAQKYAQNVVDDLKQALSKLQ